MNAHEIIQYIKDSEKKTPVKLYLKEKNPIPFPNCQIFGSTDKIIFGEWSKIKEILDKYQDDILDIVIENDCRNSAIPLLDLKEVNARIEPGAIIREKVQIGERAVIMMGAVINIGAVIGEGTMIDMNVVLGGRAMVGKNCHIGAGSVLAGVVEPPSAKPVIVEDDVLIGANAVILEGVHVHRGAVVAAGAVVIEDVPENAVVAGIPAKVIKMKDDKSIEKTGIVEALRQL
ncbi:2,3,4,5-tetrahydropyridine-2,6-dicarboxylate N-acetyltransferase [Sinanaerobacter chloroacetimidivorans]|jgi:tetrahydrodipicolinate N-acetyltransferase|uniref:2,3,4,5-tetrahydropyridine-2,6-dicarboxylate N-acetyltransferase n=1 Tax=Sinanaerobacter chloroacetimidivorans TaxID=2818044 RepID=A0A8J8B1Q5_9FIRM|nr:2,3,4,5-tetrahydropyridine-2,6-dicarboxylate N-acetyltransferase [Sinanaerobacter chloroacetimidivorans]MBR0598943.1 2,3,4,5-tetrahydropyridine-2,6-dicarboxylate N-acetyltransferase [Sinanaerobacter chloroacetimidivorans]